MQNHIILPSLKHSYIFAQCLNVCWVDFRECCVVLTALRDEQITAARLCCVETLISYGQQSIKQDILAQCKASNYLQMTQPFLT